LRSIVPASTIFGVLADQVAQLRDERFDVSRAAHDAPL
jgi:hypothetical protein